MSAFCFRLKFYGPAARRVLRRAMGVAASTCRGGGVVPAVHAPGRRRCLSRRLYCRFYCRPYDFIPLRASFQTYDSTSPRLFLFYFIPACLPACLLASVVCSASFICLSACSYYWFCFLCLFDYSYYWFDFLYLFTCLFLLLFCFY